jgi:hypothetical protein
MLGGFFFKSVSLKETAFGKLQNRGQIYQKTTKYMYHMTINKPNSHKIYKKISVPRPSKI